MKRAGQPGMDETDGQRDSRLGARSPGPFRRGVGRISGYQTIYYPLAWMIRLL